LIQQYTIDRGNFFADKTCGTIATSGCSGIAVPATETALVAIVDADIFAARASVTIPGCGTGSAQHRKVRDADEDHIRLSVHYFTTGPTSGTLLEAGLRADPVSHMVNAPTGQTVSVLGAGLQETPGTRLTPRLCQVMGFPAIFEQFVDLKICSNHFFFGR
jgi:hypothetical protein